MATVTTLAYKDVKTVMTKSSLPVGGYSVNPYVGCPHACRYCYASFMKRFTGHTEKWGTFLDVKNWPRITDPHKYDGQRIVIGSVMVTTKSDLVLRDIDLLKTFPKVTVSWSVNTLDEAFKDDMDDAPSIERRLSAMKTFHDEGIRTVCFVSPIFPGITDVPAIIDRAKDQADLIWLENLNLRGQFKGDIMRYIADKYPQLVPLYEEIYNKGKRDYWQALEAQVKQICSENDFPYLRNDLPYGRSKPGKPVIVNYFYHEEIRLNKK